MMMVGLIEIGTDIVTVGTLARYMPSDERYPQVDHINLYIEYVGTI